MRRHMEQTGLSAGHLVFLLLRSGFSPSKVRAVKVTYRHDSQARRLLSSCSADDSAMAVGDKQEHTAFHPENSRTENHTRNSGLGIRRSFGLFKNFQHSVEGSVAETPLLVWPSAKESLSGNRMRHEELRLKQPLFCTNSGSHSQPA